MPLDRIALISDAHGNLGALEAVLADAAARGATRVLNLGDNAGKGPRGSAVVDRVRAACTVNVRGNWDDLLPRQRDDAAPEMVWWRDELRPDQRAWLASLPLVHDLVVSGRRVRLLHATAWDLHSKLFRSASDEAFAAMFAATDLTGPGPEPDVVVYGDIHEARVETREGRTLVNTGSVGNPLDEPVPSYVLLEGELGSARRGPFGVQVVRVPYDVEAEIAVAEALEMPARDVWAVELRTAVYRGLQGS